MERKFKIGNIVAHIAADYVQSTGEAISPADKVRIKWGGSRACRFIVMETLDQTCHGGTQYWYKCRLLSADGNPATTFMDFAEFELVPFQPVVDKVEVII